MCLIAPELHFPQPWERAVQSLQARFSLPMLWKLLRSRLLARCVLVAIARSDGLMSAAGLV